jgi:hypothetical protein
MSDSRRYNDEDVQAIIQRALKQQGTTEGDLAHADLLSIGEQVGLPAEAIERAAHDVLDARRTAQAVQRITSSRRRWLAVHAAVFALINALLFTVNALTTPGEWWFLFSLFFWGLALGAHAAFALVSGVSPELQRRERAHIDAEANAQARPQLRVAGTERATEAVDEAPTESVEPNSASASKRSETR